MGRPRGGLSAKIRLMDDPQEGLCALPSLMGSTSLLTIDNAGEYEILAPVAGSQKTYPS